MVGVVKIKELGLFHWFSNITKFVSPMICRRTKFSTNSKLVVYLHLHEESKIHKP
jgi:hypothetical protein